MLKTCQVSLQDREYFSRSIVGKGGCPLPLRPRNSKMAQANIHKLLPKWHPFYIPRAKLYPFLIPQGQGKTVEYLTVEVFPLGFQLPRVSYLRLQASLCFLLLFLPKFGSLFYNLFKLPFFTGKSKLRRQGYNR